MKKTFLIFITTVISISTSFSQAIDSLRIIPSPATSSDDLKLVAITSYPGGPCSFVSSYPNTQSDTVITVKPIYCYESASGGCTTVDTHSIGPLPAGNYRVSLELISTNAPGPCGSQTYLLKAIGWADFTVTQGATGINSEPAATVKVYPNPVFDFVIFSLTNNRPAQAEVRVLNSGGAMVKDLRLETNPGEQLHGVDLSGLSEGIYFYTIKTQEQLLSGKLVITD